MSQEKTQVTKGQLIGLMLFAYLFSIAIRMIWVWHFKDTPDFYWNGQLMINTNDGYFFASGAQKALWGMHLDNPRVPGLWDYGVVFFTTLFAKITPFSLETIILYMPSVISSLVVIPMILIARLYGKSWWGFFAALLGSVVWSYYNRTMTGYYDTDMFSAMAPMFILYFLMKSTIDFNLRSALYAAIAISLYPFLYDQGLSIVYAMGIIYAIYLLWFHRRERVAYESVALISLALIPLGLPKPYEYIVSVIVVSLAYLFFRKRTMELRNIQIISGAFFLAFLLFGDVFGLIYGKVISYVATGTSEVGLHFYAVNQTVREAGKVLFFPLSDNMPYKANIAHRMMGSSIGLIAALIGYIVLVLRHRAFILALPLIGIGVFAHWGGLRFTVYAVPVAAMSAVYLFWVIWEYLKDKRLQYALVTVATLGLLYPNITHIIGYKVPTVMNKSEVEDLVKLNKIASDKDYTITWWDYGYPIWYYSDTSTLIDGGKHNNDNFIVSTILQTASPELAANLSRVAVETYVDSNYSVVADTLFANKTPEQKDPNLLLAQIESGSYPIPQKTRDIYFYLPYRMMNIFPTIAVFGNLDLTTGRPKREIAFYPTRIVGNQNGILKLRNGLVFDATKGYLHIGKERRKVKRFIVTTNEKNGKIALQSQNYYPNGEYVIVYMRSYGQIIVMDPKTFRSMYVQMFILEKYDKNLFELVIASPYSRIYRVKK